MKQLRSDKKGRAVDARTRNNRSVNYLDRSKSSKTAAPARSRRGKVVADRKG